MMACPPPFKFDADLLKFQQEYNNAMDHASIAGTVLLSTAQDVFIGVSTRDELSSAEKRFNKTVYMLQETLFNFQMALHIAAPPHSKVNTRRYIKWCEHGYKDFVQDTLLRADHNLMFGEDDYA